MTDGVDERGIHMTNERLVYSNAFAAVYDDEVTFRDGSTGTHLRIVEGGGRSGVAALAVSRGRTALVRTYRYPLHAWEWGIPRGFGAHDDPVTSVEQELQEELGAPPDDVDLLTEVTPNSGLLAGSVSIFVAHYSTQVAQPIDTREVAAVRWVTTDEMRDEILAGEIKDAFTLVAAGTATLKGVSPFDMLR